VSHALDVVAVATLAYVGTMFDNLFAFAAQMLVTDSALHGRIARAQAVGVAALVAVAAGVGSALAGVPLRWVGLLAVAPLGLALHAWRHRADEVRRAPRRGATTTFAVTLALGGDNLAVWIPLLRAAGTLAAVATIATFAAWELLFLSGSLRLARHPRAIDRGMRWGPRLTPFVYLALAVLVVVECRTFA
jgi:cadmium resistance protein CadD (predicted permease)